MSNKLETSESATREGASARRPWRTLLIAGGVVVAVAGLVAAVIHLPAADRAAEIQAPATQPPSGSPTVGDTQGYNITNESGAILIYHGVSGHVAAPPPQPGGAWLPGQTLNFELNTGTFGEDANTGDALFEAYTIGGLNGWTDAGTVDVHFRSRVPLGEDSSAWAYLNPSDTAPLVASSNATSGTWDGETWTMESGQTNTITSSAPQTYSVNSNWTAAGLNADWLVSSIQSAPGGECSLQDHIVEVCTLGGNTWRFSPTG